MDDLPYTLPDEDPFNISPPLFTKPRRRSSMLDKWIDQQSNTTNYLDPDHSLVAGTRTNPYLAYPDIAGRVCLQESATRSTLTIASYDLVDDDDIPEHTPPSTLGIPHPSSRTPFHSVALSFRSDSPATSSKHSRMLFFGSGRNSSSNHNRSSSLGTLRDSDSPSKWRPTVLGYFSTPSTSQTSVLPSETVYTPSRPSISSSNTYTSSSIPSKHLRVPSTPSKLSLVESMRSRRRSFGALLSNPCTENLPSLASLSLEDEQPPSPKSTVSRIPFAPKPPFPTDQDPMPHTRTVVSQATQPQVAFSATKDGTLSRFSSRNQKKKKKLVISGISAGEARKFDNIKRWCESFGEVSQIIRMPNGDLHVHFRSAEVADTVCRLRAKVFIAGVGSVNLSWYTGNKH